MSSIPEINNAYSTWDDEAFAIAKEFVYTDIKENTLPSAAYVSSRVAIAEKQLAKAGYRIALQLEKLWGSTTNDIPAESLFL
jgi:S1/P1 Nuclease